MEERIEKAFAVPPDTPVIIRNSNGSVLVRAGSGSSGRALVKRTVEPDLPHTKYVEIEIDQGPPLVIRSCYSLSRVRASVDMEVTLPPGIKALEIETINGNIVVSDMNCRIRASSSNGFIRTSGGGGRSTCTPGTGCWTCPERRSYPASKRSTEASGSTWAAFRAIRPPSRPFRAPYSSASRMASARISKPSPGGGRSTPRGSRSFPP